MNNRTIFRLGIVITMFSLMLITTFAVESDCTSMTYVSGEDVLSCGINEDGEYFEERVFDPYDYPEDEKLSLQDDAFNGSIALLSEKPEYVAEEGYGGQLTDIQKDYYEKLIDYYVNEDGLSNGNTDAMLLTLHRAGSSTDEFYNDLFYGYWAFVYDYPEIFWAGAVSVRISYTISDSTYILKKAVFTISEKYEGAYEKITEFNNGVNDTVTLLCNDVTSGELKDYYKAIHDWMCIHMYYDYDESNHQRHSCGNVFAGNGAVVCEGYGETFKVLCDQIRRNNHINGLYCAEIVGYAYSGENHMWNYVFLDGSWYGMDVTWDDQEPIRYDYYLSGSLSKGEIGSFSEEHIEGKNFCKNSAINFSFPILSQSGWEDQEETDPEIIIASGCCGANVQWSLTDEGFLSIFGEGPMNHYSYKMEVPWYSFIDAVTEVEISDSVTSISDYAFYGLKYLNQINIPEGVTSVGAYAFKNCTSLESVSLPDGMSKLGESAFYGCSSLRSIDLPNGLYTVQDYTFKNCTSLSEVSFSDTLIKIGEAAFYGCSSLTTVSIPDGVSIIGQYAFKNCTRLANVKLPAELGEIREAAFYATALSNIIIPSKVKFIGAYAFKNSTMLKSISMPDSVTSIRESAFYACTALQSVNIPDHVTDIGNYAFRKCIALNEVVFSADLKSIGECSFYGCTAITSLNLPEGLTQIDNFAFKACTSLENISLPISLQTIGESAFNTCTVLRAITIPGNVTGIGEYCFSGDEKLYTIRFMGSAPSIETGAFKNVSASVYYPSGDESWTDSVKQRYGGKLNWIC